MNVTFWILIALHVVMLVLSFMIMWATNSPAWLIFIAFFAFNIVYAFTIMNKNVKR